MRIAVLGGGAGGASAVVDLTQRKIATNWWIRSSTTLEPFMRAGGVRYEGVLGSGLATPQLISNSIAETTKNVDGIVICLPTTAHAAMAQVLARASTKLAPIIINPGHVGGALEFGATFRWHGVPLPPIAEFSTLTYVARKYASDSVRITAVAKCVRAAALPSGTAALSLAQEVFPAAQMVPDVLVTGLSDVNLVLHPPGSILGAAWVEATHGDFTFYVQGLSDGVGRVMEALDEERRAVGAAFGHALPDLFEEMQAIGTIESDAQRDAGLAAAVRNGEANGRIRAPDSLSHRYYLEDFWFGVKPLLEFARIAAVTAPVAGALMTIAETLISKANCPQGRTAQSMGIAGMDKYQLLASIRS